MAKNSKIKSEGHVYVLTSPKCEHIKIGGTDYAPGKRIREINAAEPYKSLGPWMLYDFRQVTDWRKVEYFLHYTFRDRQIKDVEAQRELFSISPTTASMQLARIDESMILRKPKVDRMFQDEEFSLFLIKLFKITGLINWMEYQGSWTFSLFPGTSGGRYYTLNIGPHEVAFASVRSASGEPLHMILMDKLILDFAEVHVWLQQRGGEILQDQYSSGLARSTSVFFEGSFNTALEFLALNGVRRAIIAYWSESLIGLQERNVGSVYARHHNWNAVAELRSRILLSKL
jgi:hypothetical protein